MEEEQKPLLNTSDDDQEPSNSPTPPSSSNTSRFARSNKDDHLMENLLRDKINQGEASTSDQSSVARGLIRPELSRSESVDSQKSVCSVKSGDSKTEDPCPCDDCLLEITDNPEEIKSTNSKSVSSNAASNWRKLKFIVHSPFQIINKKSRYPWVQLAGHQGNFRAGSTPGTILKKLCAQEAKCLRILMNDVLRPFVPEFKGVVKLIDSEDNSDTPKVEEISEVEEIANARKQGSNNNNKYIQLQDLLSDFNQPCVMDCKIGVRTYLERELAEAKAKNSLRNDMYQKMVQIDKNAPTDEEHEQKGVTKPRYMVWRETISSTASLGFRVEGMKIANANSTKDFKTVKTEEQVSTVLRRFTEGYEHAIPKYLKRLKDISEGLKKSFFFRTHELIGSSLLFVHDSRKASIWMIDFAKTYQLPPGQIIDHKSDWQVGNHEDGYLTGINNLIELFTGIQNSLTNLPQNPENAE